MTSRTITAAMAAALLTATPATAQGTATAVTDGEITQCIVALGKLGKGLTGVELNAVQNATFYFFGKLAARHTWAEAKALLDRAKIDNANMDKKDVDAVTTVCAMEVEELGTALTSK